MTGETDAPDEWIPKTIENHYLCAYQAVHPGTLWAEVGIICSGGAHDWPDGSSMRRLDGVLIVGGEPMRGCWRPGRSDEFLEAMQGHELHLLEA